MKEIGLKYKRTVRSWTTRRVRNAFKESMNKQGYNVDGTRIEGTENGKDLFGTVQLQPEEPALKMSYKEIVRQTDLAVEEMIQRQNGRDRAKSARVFQGTRKLVIKSKSKSKSTWNPPGFTITKKRM
jgi:hypothetical protein